MAFRRDCNCLCPHTSGEGLPCEGAGNVTVTMPEVPRGLPQFFPDGSYPPTQGIGVPLNHIGSPQPGGLGYVNFRGSANSGDEGDNPTEYTAWEITIDGTEFHEEDEDCFFVMEVAWIAFELSGGYSARYLSDSLVGDYVWDNNPDNYNSSFDWPDSITVS